VYALCVFDDDGLIPLSEEERAGRIRAFLFNAERLLGARQGTLTQILQVFGGPDAEPPAAEH